MDAKDETIKNEDVKSSEPELNDEMNNEQASHDELVASVIEEQDVSNTVENTNALNAPSQPTAKPEEKRRKKSKLPWLFLLIVIFLFIGVLIYGAQIVQRERDIQHAEVTRVNNSLAALKAELVRAEQTLNGQLSAQNSDTALLSQRLMSAEERIKAQNKRLLSMSTTSRDDWLLAEAEYLLKLANQRVLVERSADSAVGLLEEADSILRDLADPDLFSLRQAIQDDLVSLKLANKIDVEGIYLKLHALAKQVDSLPVVPSAFNDEGANEVLNGAESALDVSASENSFSRFFARFKGYVRVINHTEKPIAILPPDATAYLHLNLRLMIERAQLALLREQQDIFVSSLNEAENWVSRYFPRSSQAGEYKQNLTTLRDANIIATLPDITQSLELLRSYIERLHTLKNISSGGVQTSSGAKK